MESDGKCIWEYCNEKCECSECEKCPHYRPDYKKETEENKMNSRDILKNELKENHNNIITVMENHIMQMVGCDRHTANLVANEVLELDRQAEDILSK